MNDHRVMLAGRIAGAPVPIPGVAGSALVTLHVPGRGAKANVWAALFGPAVVLPRPLENGAAVALVGEVDPVRRSDGDIFGPIVVEAVLALDCEGEIFHNLEAADAMKDGA